MPISKYSHMLRDYELRLQHTDLRGQNSDCSRSYVLTALGQKDGRHLDLHCLYRASLRVWTISNLVIFFFLNMIPSQFRTHGDDFLWSLCQQEKFLCYQSSPNLNITFWEAALTPMGRIHHKKPQQFKLLVSALLLAEGNS